MVRDVIDAASSMTLPMLVIGVCGFGAAVTVGGISTEELMEHYLVTGRDVPCFTCPHDGQG